MTRDCSTLMVAQYFKRRREFVEIFIVSGSGLGIAVMSAFIKGAIRYKKVILFFSPENSLFQLFSSQEKIHNRISEVGRISDES